MSKMSVAFVKLQALIEHLRGSGDEKEEKLFRELQFIHTCADTTDAQEKLGVVIEERTGLRNQERYVRFKRLTTVYNRKMYNKFFVPIWAVATDPGRSVGFVLRPRLAPLRTTLRDVSERVHTMTGRKCEEELTKILRLCFAPIAFAIDALHAELPGKRTMYYHRDVCIDNVYMSVKKTGKKTVEYDDARLNLTEFTRGSHQEYINAHGSINRTQQFNKYHHHPALKDDKANSSDPEKSMQYHRMHDWHSFGVYILEVLDILLPRTAQREPFQEIKDYTDVTDFEERISNLGKSFNITAQRYIDIAFLCLALKKSESAKKKWEIRESSTQLFFEYDINHWTARLWWMYEDTRPDKYEPYRHYQKLKEKGKEKKEKVQICQACLLFPRAKLTTKVHSRGNKHKCGKNCWNHCARCYRNGERKFCTDMHGTTSTIIGGSSSYALLLYGEEFKNPDNKDACKKSVEMVKKTLQHQLICGIPEGNIFMEPLFGVEKEDLGMEDDEEDSNNRDNVHAMDESNAQEKSCEKVQILEAKDALKQHCDEVRRRMHGVVGENCADNAEYNLFILYCGHGNNEENPGDWCVTKDETITKEEKDDHLATLWKCTNSKREDIKCKARCGGVSYFMGQCYSDSLPPSNVLKAPAVTANPKVDTKLIGEMGGLPEFCPWLCQLLRSAYDESCVVKGSPKATCEVPAGVGDITVCTQIRQHIKGVCDNAYIDGHCLTYHEKHVCPTTNYQSTIKVLNTDNDLVLAYYNPGGVYLDVFPYSEDRKDAVRLKFHCQMECVKIKNYIAQELQTVDQNLRICLLTTRTDDYSKYELVCDDNVNDVLESSVLFYHIITKPVTVTLVAGNIDGTEERVESQITLDLNADDLESMTSQTDWYQLGSMQLPNLLVHIIHRLKNQKMNENQERYSSFQPMEGSQPEEKDAIQYFMEKLASGEVSSQPAEKNDWKCIEERARNYTICGKRQFAVERIVADSSKLRLKFNTQDDTTEPLSTPAERLIDIVKDLRNRNGIHGVRETQNEDPLFEPLDFVFTNDEEEAAQKAQRVHIDQHMIDYEREDYLIYKRLAAVYNRKMYNKFFVPVWAAAMDKNQSVGYILYPKLTPLQEVLGDIKEAKKELSHGLYEMELCKVLRLCFAPIALAIDCLHTEQPSRPMYLHHDVCIDNVYMSVRKSIHSNGIETVEYDDARLHITEPAQWSHECVKYHHHRELREPGAEYQRRHDWHSFGVYMLQVLHITFPMDSEVRFEEISKYNDVAEFKEHISSLCVRQTLRVTILQYIDIALKCLDVEEDIRRVCNYEMPDGFKDRINNYTSLSTFNLQFEYRISSCSAELVWLYEDSRPAPYKTFKHCMKVNGQKVSACQACLLNPTGKIPTKIYSRSNRLKCNEKCVHYCARCYRNGERKFCTEQHGTTSTILGDHFSYALLLYGEEFTDSMNKNTFERSAHLIQNVLQHKLICGIPETNILVRPLYDVTKKDDKKTTLSAVAALKQHCEEMRQLMHGEDSITCANDAEYKMFILYGGHGHGKAHPGDWCPTEYEVITKLERDAFLESLWQCTKSNKGQAECESSCVMVSYFMEHCYTEAELPTYVQNAAASTSYRGAATEYGTELAGEKGGLPDICRWLCQLLRSAFHEGCTRPKKGVEDSGCLVKIGRTDVCSQLRTRISDVCMDAYIDGACLMIHKDHMHPNCGFYTAIDVVCVRNEKFPLAYYNPGGVYLTVFLYSEDHGKAKELAFDCKMTRTKIKKEIAKELDTKSDHICLLTNCTDDYSKYELVCDFNLNDVLYSSVLFYHAVSQPVEVTLRATNIDGTGLQMEDIIILPLEDADLHPLIAECYKPGERLPFPQLEYLPRKSYLPNITVHIVHYLRYLKKETKTDEMASTTNQATDSEQSSESSAKDHFIRQLCGSSVDTQKLSEDQWQKIEEIAMKYVIEKRTDFTVRQPLNTTAKLSIEWTATQPTAAKLTPGLTEEENEDVGALEPENKAVMTDANATHSSQPVDALASQTSISATSDDDDTLPSPVENHLVISSLTDEEDSV